MEDQLNTNSSKSIKEFCNLYMNNLFLNVQESPYPYFYSENFFKDAAYKEILTGFRSSVISNNTSAYINYDAKIVAINRNNKELFGPLFKRELYEIISSAFKCTITDEIDAAIHQHPPSSKSGWIHNDYNPGWFYNKEPSDDMIFSGERYCEYKKNYNLPQENFTKRMRSIAIIYYLDNDEWIEGCGGETGIYRSALADKNKPLIKIPPRSNSMLAFRCSPFSFHSFLFSKIQRSSITFWLHSPYELTVRDWPYNEPVEWK